MHISRFFKRAVSFSLFLAIVIFSINNASAAICNDSDNGINYYLRGILKVGNETIGTDRCLNSTLLLEYYCLQNATNNKIWNHTTYSCTSGKCVEGACTQPRDLTPPILSAWFKNVNKTSAILIINATEQESFVNYTGIWYKSPRITSWHGWKNVYYPCNPQSKNCLQEHLITPVDGQGIYSFMINAHNRDNVFSQIYLNLTFEPYAFFCRDSDNGLNYSIRGITNVCSDDPSRNESCRAFTDICSSQNLLLEGYCSHNDIAIQNYTCPADQLCKEGACVRRTLNCEQHFINITKVENSSGKLTIHYYSKFTGDNVDISLRRTDWNTQQVCLVRSGACGATPEGSISCIVNTDCNYPTDLRLPHVVKVQDKQCPHTFNEFIIKEIMPITCEFGCPYKNKCIPYSFRLNSNYCDLDNNWKAEKLNNARCDNNYECKSNSCANDKCLEVVNGFQRFAVNALCTLMHPANPVKRQKCINDILNPSRTTKETAPDFNENVDEISEEPISLN